MRTIRHVTIVGDGLPHCLESSFARALEALGVRVWLHDLLASMPDTAGRGRRLVRRLLAAPRARRLSRRLIADLAGVETDLIVVFKGMDLTPGTITELRRRTGAPVFCYNPDNPFNDWSAGASNDRVRRTMPEYGCYLIWGKFLVPRIRARTGGRVEYLPFGFDPDLHGPAEPEAGAEPIPLGFVGTGDRERADWLRPLADLGLRITGGGWHRLDRRDPLRRCIEGAPRYGTALARLWARTAINLNLIRKQNGPAHNMRTFELPACRAFMLTNRTAEQCEFFAEGRDIACFSTPAELRRQLEYYLDRPEERRAMAESAWERVQAHTYRNRGQRLLEIAAAGDR